MATMVSQNQLAAAMTALAGAAAQSGCCLRQAIPRVAAEHFGLAYAELTTEPRGGNALALAPGLWLQIDHPLDCSLTAYAAVAGALLQQALLLEQAADGRVTAQIAQELHDGTAQTLFGLCLSADRALGRVDSPSPLRCDLEQIKELAGASLHQVREAIYGLAARRVEPAQLRPAIGHLLDELERAGLRTDLRTWGDLQSLPAELTDALYQITREALVNVRRHAAASSVLVSIRITPEAVTAVVQDDGRGLPCGVQETFRHNGTHLGLRSMESRARRLGGSLTLEPGDECGLIVTATFPLKGADRSCLTPSAC